MKCFALHNRPLRFDAHKLITKTKLFNKIHIYGGIVCIVDVCELGFAERKKP